MPVAGIELPVERVAAARSRYPKVLAPLTLRGVTFANRLFFAPMGVDLAGHDGSLSAALAEFLDGLVLSGCGAVILSNATVTRDSILQPKGLRMFSSAHADSMRAFLARASAQGVVAGIQLQHYGGQGTTTFTRGQPLLTPSGVGSKAVAKLDPRYRTRIMSLDDIGLVQKQFAESARLCRDAGAKLVQLQASNGYLLSSFLSKFTNQRSDGYGGSPMARARMVVETVRAVRQALGDEVVLGLRIGIDDGLGPEGPVPDDLQDVIPELESAGVDMFEASFCVADTFSQLAGRSPEVIGALYEKVSKVRGYCRIPLGFAGYVDSVRSAEALMNAGTADMVGMARALFADNELVLKTVEGREQDIHLCLWDGKCFKDKYNPRFDRVYCCVNPKYKRPD
jgi:2,4-dienoyl-CoA reductase-like NADH-dependent reductase (Old Yellow Enzyme family)